MATSIVDICPVSPAGGAAELLLPLLHYDMIWLPLHYTNFLFFYDFKCSESQFLTTIVPNLKKSLSLTLKHFPPLAGKIVVPLTSGMPVSRYVSGDSVAVTIALSGANLPYDDFHCFLSQMPPPTNSSCFVEIPAAAIQVTLFPNHGISVAFNLHHAVGDGASLFRFVRTWASINKFNGDAHLVALGDKFSPFYDRSVVQHAGRLAAECWNNMNITWPASPPAIASHKFVEAKFVLSEAILRKLKNFIPNERKPAAATHISSFVAATAYVWSCAVKSAAAAGETLADDEPEYFLIPADCRARLNPPLPDTYFGNCLASVLVESTHGTLKGNRGFEAAAKAIHESLGKAINSNMLQELVNLGRNRTILLAGSPTFDIYGVDFGWGRPQQYILPSTHQVFMCKARDGGIEIGLRVPKLQMEAFAANFNHGLKDTTESFTTRKMGFRDKSFLRRQMSSQILDF